MSNFPIMDLPFVPLENVVKKMNVDERVNFSLVNSRVRDIVQRLDPSPSTYRISLDYHRRNIEIPEKEYNFKLAPRTTGMNRELVRTISERVQQLQTVFPGPIETFRIASDYCQYLKNPKNIPSIENLILSGAFDGSFHDLENFLDSIEIPQKSIQVHNFDERFVHPKIFNAPILTITGSSWLKSKDLLKMNNKMVFLKNAILDEYQIRKLLKNLKKGGNSNLEVMIIEADDKLAGWNISEMLRGINTSETDGDAEFQFSEQIPWFVADYSRLRVNEEKNTASLFWTFDFRKTDGTKVSVVSTGPVTAIFVWKNEKVTKIVEGNGEPPAKKRKI